MDNRGLPLPAPAVAPPLDPNFRPAVLAFRDFVARAARESATQVRLALQQPDGGVSHFSCAAFAPGSPGAAGNAVFVERLVKFLIWARGGFRITIDGPEGLAAHLRAHFSDTPTGKFDSDMIGARIFDRPIEVVASRELPAESTRSRPLGRHLEGNRIGFDLGGSDRKVAAVVDGKVVFSEETVWDPYPQPDPQYHIDGVMDSLRKAAAHLPHVDAIGGSAAGVYVNSRPKAGSLFRAVPRELFDQRVKDMFLDIQKAWNGVPFEVVNDGEVTALAGAMSLGENSVLGIALGTSTAAGYVTPEGNITPFLNELAFVPVDYHPDAPRDEWSGDYGCGVQYLSQQAVGRLIVPAGLDIPAHLPLPEKLVEVQKRMKAGDARAAQIYRTVGIYLGYAIAHFATFYDFRHVLVLGRVTSGPGGDLLIAAAEEVLRAEFPDLAQKIRFRMPDEQEKRHGQAIAAASLPSLAGA